MLILVRGIPGSGKSTWVKNFIFYSQPTFNWIHLEADMFFEDINGAYSFDITKLRYAHEWCNKTCTELLKREHDVIVSNTFTQRWEIEPYIYMAKTLEIQYIIYRCIGQYKNIHGVPEDKIQIMKDRFEDIEGEIMVGEK